VAGVKRKDVIFDSLTKVCPVIMSKRLSDITIFEILLHGKSFRFELIVVERRERRQDSKVLG
jgi:hypothetical protein